MICEPCTYLQGPVEGSSQTSFLVTHQSLPWNGNHTPAKSLENEQQTDGSLICECGKEMCECSIHPNTPEKWIASMQASLARILVSLENKPVLAKEQDRGFTEKSCVLLASLDQGSSSWKMSPQLKATDLKRYSKTWPSWGMTVDGCAYAHPMSGHRITETGGLLWLTPRVLEVDESVENFRARMNRKRPNDRKNGYASLSMQVKAGFKPMWPTPTAHNSREEGYPAEHTRNTPTLSANVGGKLNPQWVEWLMGWPIGHTASKHLETVKSRSRSLRHGKSSRKESRTDLFGDAI